MWSRQFAFQFVNNFCSLYYLAFVKEHNEGCFHENDCMAEVSLHLLVLLVVFIAFNAIEIGSPLIIKWKADAE